MNREVPAHRHLQSDLRELTLPVRMLAVVEIGEGLQIEAVGSWRHGELRRRKRWAVAVLSRAEPQALWESDRVSLTVTGASVTQARQKPA